MDGKFVILQLNKGDISIPVPDRLRNLVPKSLHMEAVQHPTGEKQYCIIKIEGDKIKHVGLMLTDEELEAKDLKEKMIVPAVDMLRRSFNWLA
jgi:hypothetical protein